TPGSSNGGISFALLPLGSPGDNDRDCSHRRTTSWVSHSRPTSCSRSFGRLGFPFDDGGHAEHLGCLSGGLADRAVGITTGRPHPIAARLVFVAGGKGDVAGLEQDGWVVGRKRQCPADRRVGGRLIMFADRQGSAEIPVERIVRDTRR